MIPMLIAWVHGMRMNEWASVRIHHLYTFFSCIVYFCLFGALDEHILYVCARARLYVCVIHTACIYIWMIRSYYSSIVCCLARKIEWKKTKKNFDAHMHVWKKCNAKHVNATNEKESTTRTRTRKPLMQKCVNNWATFEREKEKENEKSKNPVCVRVWVLYCIHEFTFLWVNENFVCTHVLSTKCFASIKK